MANASRGYTFGEARLVGEWLANTAADATVLVNVRVGPLPPALPQDGLSAEELRALGSWRRYADAIIVRGDRLTVLEASLVGNPGKLGQLLYYSRLVPRTPEHPEWANAPLSLLLLHALPDPSLDALCAELGVQVAVYNPPWVGQYLLTKLPRARRPSLSQEDLAP
jgi:hypothetical protein